MTTAVSAIAPPAPAEDAPPRQAVVGRDLVRRYGDGDAAVDALAGVSLSVSEGELVAVMGPSGSGKSTLMNVLAGLDRPTSGAAWIAGHEVTAMGDTALTKLRRRHIGFVFQFFNLLPTLTAEENIVLPARIAGHRPTRAWLDEVIASVGLEGRRGHRPAQLSGGQQQRVAVARAILSRPTVMFADEPTGNLDSRSGGEILELLRRSADDYGQTTVMVTHDATAATIADRIVFLADGRIVRTQGPSTQAEVLDALAEVAR
jgi:putative ABC transport system ATP-binding protein